MLWKMKDLYNMQKQAKAIKKELSAIHIEAEVDWVVVTMTAEMEIVSIVIPDEMMGAWNNARLAEAVKGAISKAKKKAEQISAEKMKAMMWDMWLWLPWMWG